MPEIYTLRELTSEITGQDYDNMLLDTFEADYRRVARCYNFYKEVECHVDTYYSTKKDIDSTNKDMIVDILSKIHNNQEYYSFLSKASEMTYEEFLEIITEDEKWEKIYLDIYFGSMSNLDYEFYSLDDNKVDEYIENLYSLELNKKYIHIKSLNEHLINSITTIKSKTTRTMLLELARLSFVDVAKHLVMNIHMERYLDNIRYFLPEYRYITTIYNLPEDLLLEYLKHNGDGEYPAKYDENGAPENNITDEIIVNIAKKHKNTLNQLAKEEVD